MERKKYNLCSAMSDGVRTPIQLQPSKDHKFLKELLEVSPGHAQHASDVNSSDNDLDCNVLLNSLDSDDVSTKLCSFDRLAVNNPNTSASKTATLDTQALINQTILQQLTAIGKWFTKIEQKTVKSTTGPHKCKSRSAGIKNKVVHQSDTT